MFISLFFKFIPFFHKRCKPRLAQRYRRFSWVLVGLTLLDCLEPRRFTWGLFSSCESIETTPGRVEELNSKQKNRKVNPVNNLDLSPQRSSSSKMSSTTMARRSRLLPPAERRRRGGTGSRRAAMTAARAKRTRRPSPPRRGSCPRTGTPSWARTPRAPP